MCVCGGKRKEGNLVHSRSHRRDRAAWISDTGGHDCASSVQEASYRGLWVPGGRQTKERDGRCLPCKGEASVHLTQPWPQQAVGAWEGGVEGEVWGIPLYYFIVLKNRIGLFGVCEHVGVLILM